MCWAGNIDAVVTILSRQAGTTPPVGWRIKITKLLEEGWQADALHDVL